MKHRVTKLQLIIAFCFLSQFITNAQSSKTSTHTSTFEKDEEPPLWVDILFIFFTLLLHIIYAAKLIDYSLSHLQSEIHSKEDIIQITDDFCYEQLPHYTTKSHYDTESKPMKSPSFLCCIRCSPKIFTWERTLYIRQFLRFYMTISTLIAMVFYFEFLGNLFLEYFVTILIHCRESQYWYYTVSLLLIPEIIFVFRTYIWLSWDAVVAAWHVNSDQNGDIESRRGDIFKNTQHIVQQLKALKTKHDNNEKTETTEDEKAQKQSESIGLGTNDIDDIKETETETNKSEIPQTNGGTEKETVTIELEQINTEMKERNEAAITGDVDTQNVSEKEEQKSKATEAANSSTLQALTTGISLHINSTLLEVSKLFGIDNPQQSDSIPDYFIGTCFRLWFFVLTLLSAMVATIFVGTELEFTSTFYGFGLRYMAIGGLLWCLVYTMYAFYFAIISRLHNYQSIIESDTQSIWNFILLIDVKDKQQQHKTWAFIKCVIVLFCTVGGIIFIIIGLATKEGFVIFIGLTLMTYWWCNIFTICKPYSLISLLQGNIPPPSMRNHAHRIIEHKWKELRVGSEAVSAYAEIADEEQQAIIQIAQQNRKDIVKSVCAVLKGLCHPCEFIEEHRYRNAGNNSNRHALNALVNEASIKELDVPFDSVIIEHALIYINLMDGYRTEQGRYRYHNLHGSVELKVESEPDFVAVHSIEFEADDNGKAGADKCCDYIHFSTTMRNFKRLSGNYSDYWFKVYKPFEEFDITTDETENVLHGFQFLRYFTDKVDDKELNDLTKGFFTAQKKRRKKSCCGYCKKCLSSSCKKLLDCSCNALILFAIVFAIGSIGWSSITFNKELNAIDSNPFGYNKQNVSQTYAICTDEYYASQDHNQSVKSYNVLDLLYMIQGSYAMDNYNLTQFINKYFDEDDFEIVYASTDYPVFYHLKQKEQALHFIAIRGTEEYFEYLQDLSLFFEAATFQFLSFLLPLLNALPTGFIRRVVLYSSLPEGLVNSNARWHLYEGVYSYCKENIILSDLYADDSTVYLVGHSLGGAIANIAAAKLYDDFKDDEQYNMNILAFGVANPGLLYSSAKFDFSTDSYDFTATSVLPRGELVGSIDEHGGLIQHIACKHDKFYNCHKLNAPVCEIYNNCPSHMIRNSDVFDCYCNPQKSKYQFGHCLNVTCIDPDGKCI